MTEEDIKCENLMVNELSGTGYWFCKEKGSLRVDKEYCENCKKQKELDLECKKGNSNFWLRIANCMGKNKK